MFAHFIHKRRLRQLLIPMLAAAILTPSGTALSSAGAMQKITINGSPAQADLINVNGSLMVRSVFLRHAGVSVQWNSAEQAVVFQKEGSRIALKAGEHGVFHKPEGTYVPLRHTVQSLGMEIAYDANTMTANIVTGNAKAKRISDISDEDLYWLHQITEAEAGGEPYEGRAAVAAVILNRIDSPDWPDTIQDVIFQIVEVEGTNYYQFSPVLDGRIYEVKPDKETKRAVQEALNGYDPTEGATVFYNPAKTDNQWVRERPVSTVIGNHVFSY